MWSPAGNWIVFILTREGHTGLWLIHPDGSGLRQVAGGWYACWSNDGQWLYYTPAREVLDTLKECPSKVGSQKWCDRTARAGSGRDR